MVEDLAYMVYEINETQSKATAIIENNPKGKKAEHAILLEKLKKFITSIYKVKK